MSYRYAKWRLILAAACLVSAIVAPPWVPFLFALALAVRYRAWEIVAIGVFMDLLWLPRMAAFEYLPWATIIALALVVVFEPLRRELLVHDRR